MKKITGFTLALTLAVRSTSAGAAEFTVLTHETPQIVAQRDDARSSGAYCGAYNEFAGKNASAGNLTGGSAVEASTGAFSNRAKGAPSISADFVIDVADRKTALEQAGKMPGFAVRTDYTSPGLARGCLMRQTERSHPSEPKENHMQFMLIFNETEADFSQRDGADTAQAYWGAWNAYIGAMGQAGVMVSGNGLQPTHTATRVQVRDGKRHIHNGPYPDSKEHLGGYVVIEVPSLDDALTWAARSPNVTRGTTEVRPVLPPPVAA